MRGVDGDTKRFCDEFWFLAFTGSVDGWMGWGSGCGKRNYEMGRMWLVVRCGRNGVDGLYVF